MKEKCRYADKYKAIYPPRCGCATCAEKWYEAVRSAESCAAPRLAAQAPPAVTKELPT